MNIYKISQTENNRYDTFDSAIVCAESEEAARLIIPGGYDNWGDPFSVWCSTPEQVTVTLVGTACSETKKGVVLSSFNAG